MLDATCNCCSDVQEDLLHSLWSCSGLKEVWGRDFGWIFRSGSVFSSFKDLTTLVFTKPELVPLFAATTWSIWYHRNKVRVGENVRLLNQIFGFARDYMHGFKSIKRCSTTVYALAPKVWNPPIGNEWKINFDGAMFNESGEAGIGVVVQNSIGEVKAALAEKIKKRPTVEVLELLATRRVALFSEDLGLDKVIFEGDS